MQIRFFKKHFFEVLAENYPEEEINSFFNFLSEEYLQMNRLQLAMNPKKILSPEEENKFEKALFRLKNNEPVQYIISKTEFFGLNFKVNKNVLIPRPETEELVEWIISEVSKDKNPKILDIGTGSGCIAISLAKNLPGAKVFALDVSEEALKVARENADLNKVQVKFVQQDILKSKKLDSSFDIIVSNPPYVRELEQEEMLPNVLKNEPVLALFVKDENPLLFYEKITKLASANLGKGGKLFFEINQYLPKETELILKNEDFNTELRKDIFGNYRMLKGIKK